MRSQSIQSNDHTDHGPRGCTPDPNRGAKCILAMVILGSVGMASTGVDAALYTNGDVTTGVAGTINVNGNENELNDGNAYALDLTNLGRASSNVSLKILNGSTNTYAATLAMGYTTGAGPGNLLLVSGTGSALVSTGTAAPGAIIGALNFSGQSFTIENGGAASFTNSMLVGRRGTASNNVVTVDNGTLTLSPSAANALLRIGGDAAATSGTGNRVSVKNDGTLVAGNGTYKVDVTIGFAGATAVGNDLTLASGGLFKLVNSASTVTIQSGNYVRFDGGYLAWNGDKTASLAESAVQVWDSGTSSYVAGDLGVNYTATYYVDSAAAVGAGFDSSLGGYTIFTNVVPEPTSAAALSIFGLSLLRRRRRD